MENTNQENKVKTENSEDKDFTCHDWREERRAWREKHRAWREEMREHRHWFPFHGLFWGLGLVLVGVLFLLNQTGAITGDTWWQSLLIGLGVIWIINGLVRYNHPEFHWGAYSKIVFGIVLILVGALFIAGTSEWWPVVLIVAGVAFLLRFFWRRQSMLS